MIDVKGAAARIPLFAMKAIDTPEHKLVAEPIAIAAVVLVTSGAMPPKVGLPWIFEADHLAPLVASQASFQLVKQTGGARGDLLQVIVRVGLQNIEAGLLHGG